MLFFKRRSTENFKQNGFRYFDTYRVQCTSKRLLIDSIPRYSNSTILKTREKSAKARLGYTSRPIDQLFYGNIIYHKCYVHAAEMSPTHFQLQLRLVHTALGLKSGFVSKELENKDFRKRTGQLKGTSVQSERVNNVKIAKYFAGRCHRYSCAN